MNDPTKHVRSDLSAIGKKPVVEKASAAPDSKEKTRKLALAIGLLAVAAGIYAWNFLGGPSRDKDEIVSTTLGGSADPGAAGGPGAASAGSTQPGDDEPRRDPFEIPVGGRPFASMPDPNAPTEDDEPEPATPPPEG